MIPAFLAGAFAWSLAEYLIHDRVGHRAKGRNDFSREHLAHHRDNTYFAATRKKVVFAVVVVGPMAALGWLLAGAVGVAFAAGFGAAYTGYEVLHRRIHTTAPPNRYGLWARRHHLQHHHRDATQNHGVSSPLWDLVFGTWDRATPVRIPRKRAPAWLVGSDGEIRPEYADHFVLVGPAAERAA